MRSTVLRRRETKFTNFSRVKKRQRKVQHQPRRALKVNVWRWSRTGWGKFLTDAGKECGSGREENGRTPRYVPYTIILPEPTGHGENTEEN